MKETEVINISDSFVIPPSICKLNFSLLTGIKLMILLRKFEFRHVVLLLVAVSQSYSKIFTKLIDGSTHQNS